MFLSSVARGLDGRGDASPAPRQVQATRKEAEAARSSEATTREKLDAYVDKFESFQGTLTKSNETFKLYQSELKKVRGSPARLRMYVCACGADTPRIGADDEGHQDAGEGEAGAEGVQVQGGRGVDRGDGGCASRAGLGLRRRPLCSRPRPLRLQLQRVQAENTRVSGQRDKLQGLCRSLQEMRKSQDERVKGLEAALAERGASPDAPAGSPEGAAAGDNGPPEEGAAAAAASE